MMLFCCSSKNNCVGVIISRRASDGRTSILNNFEHFCDNGILLITVLARAEVTD